MGDLTGQLGVKLGPRLAQLMAQATIATRQQMMDLEHRIRVESSRTVVDWMGLELGQIMAPLTDPILKSGTLPPAVQKVMENITSGKNQWQALAGMAFGSSGVSSTLSTIMSNYLAPTVYAAVGAAPALVPDIATLAQLAARGRVSYGHAEGAAAGLGINAGWFSSMVEASRVYPDLQTMIELWRKGVIGGGQITEVLQASGFPEDWASAVLRTAEVPLSVADAALAVLRGNLDMGTAQEVARLNGVSTSDLQVVIDNTGEPPALEALLQLWRRGVIGDDVLERGIRQSRVRDEWIPQIKQLGVAPPSAGEVLDALVKGQTDRATAERRWREGGGDPTWFDTAFHTAGASPTPDQLGVLANRGIIPWTGLGPDAVSFEQGFHEGQWRDKWQAAFRELATYLPPPRTVTAMFHEGSLTREEALSLLQKTGLSPELAAGYVNSGSSQKLAKHKELAVGEITALYADKAIDHDAAASMLQVLGYDQHEAEFVLEIADLARIRKFTEQAIGTVKTEYTNHTIDRAAASSRLDALQVPAGQRDDLLALWTGDRQIRSKRLTEAQVVRALKKQIIDAPTAIAKLVQLGYPEDDAQILIQL